MHAGRIFCGVLGDGLEQLSLGEEPVSLGVESVDGYLVMSGINKQPRKHLTKIKDRFLNLCGFFVCLHNF